MKSKMFRGWAMVGAMVALAGAACSPTTNPSGTTVGMDGPEPSAVEEIRANDLYARIALLSADSMGGRDTPSPGLEAAAAYLAGQYQQLGFQPGGESSSFYQRYPFRDRRAIRTFGAEMQEAFVPNVIAILPGSDPALRNEYVVLSAHFDHVGVGMSVNGDTIYNGADDNGSGTAALLEIAGAFKALPTPPRRSILFLHVSGEEHGLLGSEYFSQHPTVPLEQIVADVNVDMIGRNSPGSIVAIGKNYSNLGVTVNEVRDRHPELGLEVLDDPWPQERFFFRSDHYNFARNEVPAIFFFAGVHEDYHRPSDSVEKIDTDKAERVSQMIFYTVYQIANATERPKWYPAGWEEVRSMTR